MVDRDSLLPALIDLGDLRTRADVAHVGDAALAQAAIGREDPAQHLEGQADDAVGRAESAVDRVDGGSHGRGSRDLRCRHRATTHGQRTHRTDRMGLLRQGVGLYAFPAIGQLALGRGRCARRHGERQREGRGHRSQGSLGDGSGHVGNLLIVGACFECFARRLVRLAPRPKLKADKPALACQ